MSSLNYQIHNLALEEASEGRRSARGTRNNVSRSQSPKNSTLRQSTTPKSNSIFGSPQRNVYAQQDFNNLSSKAGVSDFRSSPNAQYPASHTPPPNDNPGNNNLTVDFLLQKVDDLLKQSQTPVKPQFNQQARQEAPSYSQANPFVQNSSPSGLRQSITLEGKPRKNEIFVKKSYDVPRDSKSLMTNPAKDLQAPRPVESKNELFPIRESMRNSTLSIGPTRSPNRDDIQSDMGDIRSRLNNLENQLNAVGTSRYNNSTYNDPYVTPRGQSVPPLRTDSLYSAPPTQSQYETIKKSPYTGGDYLSYSVEKPNNRPTYIETNPRLDAEVSEQICQTIDNLIQTHLLDNRSPSKSGLMSQRTHTSPVKTYNRASTAHLYKSSILPNTEPYHMSSPPLPSSSSYNNYQPSTYEPTYSVYESRYDTTLPKYEPYRPYEPLQSYETRSAYEPFPAYETKSRYDPLPSYDRDLRSPPSYTSSYNQGTLTAGDYDGSLSSRTRPKYVRPLHRNSPPRYGDYQNNWSASGSKYISPRSHTDYFNKPTSSGLSTPKRENPYSHQDTSSTDRKMKKLTLKSKVSEEKDYDRMELPKQNYARKRAQRQSFRSSDLLPDHDDNERLAYAKNKQSFKSGDMLPDNESCESDNVSSRANQKKVRAAPTQAQVPERTVSQKNNNAKSKNGAKGYKAGELEDDDDRNAGGMFDDNTPRATANANDAVGELVDDSEGEEWEEREEEVDHAKERERERERERVREKAKEYEREKERERVREQEKQRLRQSQKVTRNVDDDGKAWGLVHKVPNSMFEDAENSFDFAVTEPKQTKQGHEAEDNRKNVVRASNTVKPKSSLQQQQPRKDSGKAMIWAMEQPLSRSQRQSMSDLSDSIRRTEKKPVISHVFEKSGRHAY